MKTRQIIRRVAARCVVALGWAAGLALGVADPTGADLERPFAAPPDSARPWVWGHWLHGNVSRESITRDLEAIQRVGLGGVTMFDVAQVGIPPGPHGYLGPEWQALFAHEIAEASRLGLQVMSQNGPGYSGNGGPWIPPELGMKKIVESSVRIPGGQRYSGKLPQPAANGGFLSGCGRAGHQRDRHPGGFQDRGTRSEAPGLAELHQVGRHPQCPAGCHGAGRGLHPQGKHRRSDRADGLRRFARMGCSGGRLDPAPIRSHMDRPEHAARDAGGVGARM